MKMSGGKVAFIAEHATDCFYPDIVHLIKIPLWKWRLVLFSWTGSVQFLGNAAHPCRERLCNCSYGDFWDQGALELLPNCPLVPKSMASIQECLPFTNLYQFIVCSHVLSVWSMWFLDQCLATFKGAVSLGGAQAPWCVPVTDFWFHWVSVKSWPHWEGLAAHITLLHPLKGRATTHFGNSFIHNLVFVLFLKLQSIECEMFFFNRICPLCMVHCQLSMPVPWG